LLKIVEKMGQERWNKKLKTLVDLFSRINKEIWLVFRIFMC
jgi:hypothetical protein